MSNWLGLREDQRIGESLSALLLRELGSTNGYWRGIEGRHVIACDPGRPFGIDVTALTPSRASTLLQREWGYRAVGATIEIPL